MPVGEPRNQERARDRGQRHAGEQQPRGRIAPASLAVRVREPRIEAVVPRRHRGEDRDQQPGRAGSPRESRHERAGPDVRLSPTLEHGPHDRDEAGRQRQRDQGAPPASEDGGERHRDRRRDGGTELDPRRVDAGARRRLLRHGLADGERRERGSDPHADPDPPRQEHHEPRARRHRAQDPERPDQREPDRHRAPRAEPGGEVGGDRREEPHAEHRDRAEQPDERVRRVEVVLDVVDQRPDADDLRPQRERGEEEAGEGRSGGATGSQRPAAPAVFARWRAMRANSSTCLRASRPAGAGLPERIASRIGTCFSAASCGSTYVP